MDDALLDKLQFGVVRRLLAERCSCGLGRLFAERLRPDASLINIQRWLTQVRELQSVNDSVGLPPLGGLRDVRDAVQASGTPAGLEADVLAEIATTLTTTGLIALWTAKLPLETPQLAALAGRIGDYTPLADKIGEALDDRGKVRDHASPKLASIRATIERAKDQIDIVFSRMLRHASVTRYLQYANATFHNDRKVLPLKAEYRGRVEGIVHRSSDSGATLFIEPAEAVELNNTIVRLGVDENKEVGRILGELSRLVYQSAEGICKSLASAALLDLLVAKVRYAKDYHAAVPEVTAGGGLELRQARHPVLERMHRQPDQGETNHDVVPIDVRLGEDFDLLVITGPNTGGKTVALKTVGLLVLMAQSGIPIPVAPGSRLPIYKHVYVDVGDEQSIEQSLSTFSSHLSNLLHILKHAGRGSLVLIDELGAGTDPDEGAAIGRAIMGELRSLGAHAMITTHLSNLKSVAFTEPRVDNACVEFDERTLKPLYRLRLGEPGNSNALIIAERLGMPQRLIALAKSHLDQRHLALNRAIAGTLESRRQAEQAREHAHQAKQQADETRLDFERQTLVLAEAKQAHDRWVQWMNGLRPGDEVYVRSFDRAGRVVRLQLHKQTAIVAAGAIDFEISLRELGPVRKDEP